MSDRLRAIRDLSVGGRRVFIRADLNVPLEGARVTDDTRIRGAVPTIEHTMREGGRAVVASHLGRPKGQRKQELSLEPVAARLAELLSEGEVRIADDCIGDGARKVVSDLREGQVALLENLRFHPGEEQDDEGFARELAKLADLYVNDAFGAAHRAHSSVHAFPRLMPAGTRAAGFLMDDELRALGRLLGEVERPYVAVLGGAKVTDKVSVLESLMTRVDALLIGGAMANTFLGARGQSVGRSRVEEDRFPVARSLLEKARARGVEVLLPTDVVVAPSTEAEEARTVPVDAIPDDMVVLDIGPESTAEFGRRIQRANTVFWNGPMGLFEKAPFAAGTLGVSRAVAQSPGFTVVGGGDSVAAVQQAGVVDHVSHLSTGGGASLEYLEGRKLPGVEALQE